MSLLIVVGVTPAWGAFPTTAAPTETDTAAGTSHTVNLPTCASGNLLLIFGEFDGDGGALTYSGYTEIHHTTHGSGSSMLTTAYRFTDGSEGSTTSVTSANSISAGWQVYCVSGVDTGTVPEDTATANEVASSTDPDPPSLTPSWGAADTLWFVASSASTATGTVDGCPADYGNLAENPSGGARISTCRRELNATSDDPGVWPMTVTGTKVTITVAVKPAAAAGRGSQGPLLGVW